MRIGIEAISFYVPNYFLDLKTLAEARALDANKFYKGLGQEKMAVPAPDEDIVTMGANAAFRALQQSDPSRISAVILATESGVDQSKAAAIYIQSLLNLPSNCLSFELKQACCSSSVALITALGLVRQDPSSKVLVVASDIARYGLGTPGEPTQGAGAVAFIVSAKPTIMTISSSYGVYSEDVMDFWRPNYSEEAFVDGKYSIKLYLKSLVESWKDYGKKVPVDFGNYSRFCYHLPFTRMAEKGHFHLAKHELGVASLDEVQLYRQIEPSLVYNRLTGNLYTGSLYVALCSLLDNDEQSLAGQKVALFGYGSGCMGIFLEGTVQDGYRKNTLAAEHREMLSSREELSCADYERFYNHSMPRDGSDYLTPHYAAGRFRLAGLSRHKRVYEKVQQSWAGFLPQDGHEKLSAVAEKVVAYAGPS